MATNNNGNRIDSAGNVAPDFVWGNMPLQPNDERAASISQTGGGSGDYSWSATTKVASARLDFALDNHVQAETAYSGYPSYTPSKGVYQVTAASGDGTTVTYTSFNNAKPGDVVTITGLTTAAFNLTSATVASAGPVSFTVTNSATGTAVTGASGFAKDTTVNDGEYVSGVAYMLVPEVRGLTTTLAIDALKDAGYLAADITSTTGVTNTATQPTGINVTTTSAATVTIAGGTTSWPVGTKVTIAAGTGIPTALVGTWSVTGGSGSTLVIAGSGWTVANTGAITPGTVLTGATLTVKTQSVAAAADSIALGTTITITSWA
jgi:hypothetical protein